MRVLIGPTPVSTEDGRNEGDPDLHEWYGLDWLMAGGLRVNFVASVDGAASADGRSAGLQTPGDNRVFAALRDLADVVLVGAGTAKAEGYALIRVTELRAAKRRELGLADYLPTAVVSQRLDLDPTSSLFVDDTGAAPEHRTVVVTSDASAADRRAALAKVADVVVAGDDAVDLPAARAALVERGFRRILCEGGPALFASLAAAGVVDELDLTISPQLVGPDVARVVAGPAWTAGPRPLALSALLTEDDALFARYQPASAD